MPIVSVVPSTKPNVADAAPLPRCDTPAQAAEAICDQLLSSSTLPSREDTLLVRALGEDMVEIRAAAFDAAQAMLRGPGRSHALSLLTAFEAILDHPPQESKRAERLAGAVLNLMGLLGEALDQEQLSRLLRRQIPLLAHDSSAVASGAAKGIAHALKGALISGCMTADGEVKSLLSMHLQLVCTANSGEHCRAGPYAVGAVIGAAGLPVLESLGVMAKLTSTIEGKPSKEAPYAREAAVLTIEQLSLQLGPAFEPHGVPLLRTLVALYADKEKKVADAAVRAVRALLCQLTPLAVKLVLPALYDGMEAVQWRTKVECLQALAVLARHAPDSVGPRLPVAIPRVMECLANTNAKVLEAASEALPLLCSCVRNPETQKLKPLIIDAFIRPETMLEFLDELLCTTFVNAMDGTSLAFLMPLLLRALNESSLKYSLAKKAAVASGNVCALVKTPAQIAPFVSLFEPALAKCLEHSSPDVRAAAEVARLRLLEGAGNLQFDAEERPRQVSSIIRGMLMDVVAQIPAPLADFVSDVAAELLEQILGGDVKLAYMLKAPEELKQLMRPFFTARPNAPTEAQLAAVCEAAVAAFRERMSEQAKAILNSADGKDYCLDVQNAILAFAGRVLLKGCDLRFERGHRYGMIGQNGVGKTTLLNRLAAKDITGFPTELRVWYIRHEVVCDDGVDVRSFMKMHSLLDEKRVIETLDEVGFTEALQTTFVNNLSGGWKMKLSIAISILQQPELLLLDEPTNHLDRNAVAWLTRHLLSLKGVTILVVSHDYDFIEQVATDVAHYDNEGQAGKPCHLNYYPMGFAAFQELKPEIVAGLPTAANAMASATAAALGTDVAGDDSDADGLSDAMGKASISGSASGFTSDSDSDSLVSDKSATISRVDELMASGQILPIRFPDPGKPEGIRTYRKPILTMKNISFRYPAAEKFVLSDATVTVTLGSRAVLLGANGAGKSTFLKLLVGDLELMEDDGAGGPPKGEAWKHHNLRVSYIAQHSLHHLEDYIDQSPMAYIMERFRQGLDRDVAKLKAHLLTDEEKEEMTDVGQVREVIGRQQRGKQIWYEVRKTGRKDKDTQWYPLSELETAFRPYVKKLVKSFDEKQMALDSGMAIRPITSTEILAHLADFGIDQALAHGKIKQMSGGQRQRLVLSAAFWSKPHLICLDEPTNYLDNDTLAALTLALKTFKGAVVTVSHNQAFVAEIANEKWIVDGGEITSVMLRDAKAR